MIFPLSNHVLHNRYRLNSILGIGGQAVVYRSIDETLEIERAVKVLSPQLMYEGRARHRFESEARIMAGLDHPNIVQIFDIISTDQYLFIVMELLGQQSLWDWVKKNGPLPEQSIVDVMKPILDAIHVAHLKGIVHRDIKPSNILLSQLGVPKLTDFGIAHIHPKDTQSQFTKTGTVMGTWGYMSPEQRQNAKTVDQRADVYALGATIYALATGNRPIDLFACNQDDTILDGLSHAMMHIIQKCTAYSSKERYDSSQALSQALTAAESEFNNTPEGFEQPTGKAVGSDEENDLNHPDVMSLLSLLSDSSQASDHTKMAYNPNRNNTIKINPESGNTSTTNQTYVFDPALLSPTKTFKEQTENTSKMDTSDTVVIDPSGSARTNQESEKNNPFRKSLYWVLLLGLALGVYLITSPFLFGLGVGFNDHSTESHESPDNPNVSASEEAITKSDQQMVQSCRLIAQTLLNQQNDDGGFSGIPQFESSLWDSAQQITALNISQVCGIDVEEAKTKVTSAMHRWMSESVFSTQHGYASAWFYLSTAHLQDASLKSHSEQLLDQFRLSDGAYSVTRKSNSENRPDPYATTMAAWAMYKHGKSLRDSEFNSTVMQLKAFLEDDQRTVVSGLEEQAWWVLWTIGQELPEAAPSSRMNQRLAQQMIKTCRWDQTTNKCSVPTWPDGKISFVQSDGQSIHFITQGLPWATIASNTLRKAPGLADFERQELQKISDWTNLRLSYSPETLVSSPGYILSESLLAISVRVTENMEQQ